MLCKGVAVFAVFLAVLAVATATAINPTKFYGGSFARANGVKFAQGFGSYSFGSPQAGWKSESGLVIQDDAYDVTEYSINDMDSVRGGVFVVGQFTSIGGVRTRNVAYYDGKTWCAVKNGPSNTPLAVHCPDHANCYVAGSFTSLTGTNGEEDYTVRGFVHYQYNVLRREWEVNEDVFAWTTAPGVGITRGSLTSIGSPATHFFLRNGTSILRGSFVDNGWVHFLPPTIDCVNDFKIIRDSIMYVVSDFDCMDHADLSEFGNAYTTNIVGAPGEIHWESFLGERNQRLLNQSLVLSFTHVAVTEDASTFYLAGQYRPDLDTTARPAVLHLSNKTGSQIEPLGAYPLFHDSPYPGPAGFHLWIDGVTPYIQGEFIGANWVFDASDARSDRPLDWIYHSALYNAETQLWEQPFGGGYECNVEDFCPVTYNAVTERFYFANVKGGYDFLASGVVYFDSSDAFGGRNQPRSYFPVLPRALFSRRSQTLGFVYSLLPDTQNLILLVGGNFDYYAEDERGAVLGVRFTGENFHVGGGLWYLDENTYTTEGGRLIAGRVNALLKTGAVIEGVYREFYFAGGLFARSRSGECLRNVAALRTTSIESEEWSDVEGGCDGEVLALAAFQGKVYVGGKFRFCGNLEVNGVAGFDPATGQWFSLQTGLTRRSDSEDPPFVDSFTIYHDQLAVGGFFSSAAGVPCLGVCLWDGRKWSALESNQCQGCRAVGGSELKADPLFRVFSVQAHGGWLYAVGTTRYGSEVASYSPVLLRYGDRRWEQLSSLPLTHHDDADESSFPGLRSPAKVPIAFNGTKALIGFYSDPQYITFPMLKKRGVVISDSTDAYTFCGFPDFANRVDRETLRTYDEPLGNFVPSAFTVDGVLHDIQPIY